MIQKIGLLYCESLSDEIKAVLTEKEFPDLMAIPYLRHCGERRSGWDPISDSFNLLKQNCNPILIIGCGCMTPVIPPESAADSPEIIIPDLFSDILLSEPLVSSYVREGAYLIVPSNLTRWEDFFSCQGFEPQMAQLFLSESIRRIICVDILLRPETKKALTDRSSSLGIPAEYIPVGTPPLHRYISFQYQIWKSRKEQVSCREIVAAAHRNVADYAMMVDLLGEITTARDEGEVIEKILDLFTLLFSPHAMGYLRMIEEEPGEIVSRPPGYFDEGMKREKFLSLDKDFGIADSKTGFYITVSHDQIPLGLLVLEDLAFPERIPDYLDICQFLIKVCGLALINARRFHQIEVTVKELGEEVTYRKKIEEALHLASKKLNLLSSITRHDILNSLNAIQLYLEHSKSYVKDEEKLSGFIENEFQITKDIQHQIEFTRYYEEIGISDPQWQDMANIIHIAAQSLNLQNIALHVDLHGLEVFCDSLIEKVFYNLIENSLRHGEHVTIITISCTPYHSDMMLIYADDGVGVSVEEKEKIFGHGFGKHTGFGMFLTKEILSITGISIQECGEPGKGVRFQMIIPEGKFRRPGVDIRS